MQSFCSHGATMASLNQDILRQVRLPDLPLSAEDAVDRVLEQSRCRAGPEPRSGVQQAVPATVKGVMDRFAEVSTDLALKQSHWEGVRPPRVHQKPSASHLVTGQVDVSELDLDALVEGAA